MAQLEFDGDAFTSAEKSPQRMVVPAHIGFEHPSLLWLVGVGILMFAAGLAVNLYRATDNNAVKQDAALEDE